MKNFYYELISFTLRTILGASSIKLSIPTPESTVPPTIAALTTEAPYHTPQTTIRVDLAFESFTLSHSTTYFYSDVDIVSKSN